MDFARRLALGLLVLRALGFGPPLFGQESDGSAGTVPGDDVPVGRDSAAVASFFEPPDLIFGSIVVGSFLAIEPLEGLDQGVQAEAVGHVDGRDAWPRAIGRALGSVPGAVALAGGTFLVGWVSGVSSLEAAGLHSLEAMFVGEAAAQLIKFTVGRSRPRVSSDSDVFQPLRLSSDYHSFPSGHTTKIFAIAATFSSDLSDEAPWVPFVAYPIATWAASTRVLDNEHWLTDLVGGAALGILSSRFVDRLNHRERATHPTWMVLPARDGGIAIAFSAAH